MRISPFLAVLTLLPALLLAEGCGGTRRAPAVAGSSTGAVVPVAVSEDEFAARAQEVLSDGTPGEARRNLLAGLVRRQLLRAERRFADGHQQAGFRSLTGAFYLVRAGEMDVEMVRGGDGALRAGAQEAARRGDEGSAVVLYGLLRAVLPAGPERDQVDAHLANLAAWIEGLRGGPPLREASALHRRAAGRSLLEGSRRSVEEAAEATAGWIRRGLELNSRELPITTPEERDEALEAFRALRAGGAAIVALYLRHGDAQGALEALTRSDLLRLVPPGLVERLNRAAAEDDSQAWLDLYRVFDTASDPDRPEASVEPALAEAAAWGSALELYRSAPNDLRAAAPLSLLLVRLGMSDAAQPVVASALGASPGVDELAFALNLLLRSVAQEDEVGDPAMARRVVSAAQPTLARAEQGSVLGRVRPSPAQVWHVLGAIEARAGEVEPARRHVQEAVRREPSVDSLSLLASLERQRGALTEALRLYEAVVDSCKREGNALCEAESWLDVASVARQARDPARQGAALAQALARALDARQNARRREELARAERVLASTLDLYGERDAARRADRRAWEAARGDPRESAAVALHTSRRALVALDLGMAREALDRAEEARLGDEDVVYVALWLLLAERRAGARGDGRVAALLAKLDGGGRWPALLAAWGRGKLSDADLRRGARNLIQRVEADFYAAMNGSGDDAALEPIARGPAIELVETWVAREIIDRKMGPPPRLPPGVRLP